MAQTETGHIKGQGGGGEKEKEGHESSSASSAEQGPRKAAADVLGKAQEKVHETMAGEESAAGGQGSGTGEQQQHGGKAATGEHGTAKVRQAGRQALTSWLRQGGRY